MKRYPETRGAASAEIARALMTAADSVSSRDAETLRAAARIMDARAGTTDQGERTYPVWADHGVRTLGRSLTDWGRELPADAASQALARDLLVWLWRRGSPALVWLPDRMTMLDLLATAYQRPSAGVMLRAVLGGYEGIVHCVYTSDGWAISSHT